MPATAGSVAAGGGPTVRKLLGMVLAVLAVKQWPLLRAVAFIAVWKLRSLLGLSPPRPAGMGHGVHVLSRGVQYAVRRIPNSILRAGTALKAHAVRRLGLGPGADFKFPMAVLPGTPGHVYASRRHAPGRRERWGPGDVVLVFIHGGGFHILGPYYGDDSQVDMLRTLERDARVTSASLLSVEYPLAPRDCWFSAARGGSSQAIDAVVDTIKWLHTEWGVPVENMIVSGDSAGGNLVLTSSAQLVREGFYTPERAPKCLVVMSPWVDMRTPAVCNQPLPRPAGARGVGAGGGGGGEGDGGSAVDESSFVSCVDSTAEADSSAFRSMVDGEDDGSVVLDSSHVSDGGHGGGGGAATPCSASSLQRTIGPRPGSQAKHSLAEASGLGLVADTQFDDVVHCILDAPLIDYFAKTYLGDNSGPLATHPFASPRFLRPGELVPARVCPIVVSYSHTETFGGSIHHWIDELRAAAEADGHPVDVHVLRKDGMPHDWLLVPTVFGFGDLRRLFKEFVLGKCFPGGSHRPALS